MKKFTKTLVAGAAMMVAAATAFASSPYQPAPAIGNFSVQWQFQDVYSHLNLYGNWIGGDLRATSAAIGNNATASYEGSSWFINKQFALGDVGATLNAHLNAIGGDASFTAAGICNTFSLAAKGADYTKVDSRQACNTIDPFAIANVGAGFVGGDLTVSAVAMGNNLVADLESATSDVTSVQINDAVTFASASVNVGDVVGDVTVTAAAIGNNLSITQTQP